jgi:hypothetical protein
LAAAVVSGVLVFALAGQEPDYSLSDNNTIIPNTVSPEDSVPYVPEGAENSEPSIGIVKAELSNLPLLNEVVTVTTTAVNVGYEGYDPVVVEFFLKEGWEFVNVPKNDIEIVVDDDKKYYVVAEQFTVEPGETQTFTKQIKPIKTGIIYFKTGIPFVEYYQFSLAVGKDRTVPTQQYWEENPDIAPWNNAPEPPPCIYADCEPEPLLPSQWNSTSTSRPLTVVTSMSGLMS